jgi:hypothetical protein
MRDVARRPSHRVLLVRQWDQQVGGSGCCGRFSSVSAESLCSTAGDDPYAHARADMEVMGAVYRSVRDRYSDDQVEVTVVDPRNTAWLLPAIWRDARRRGLGRLAALRQVHRGTSPCAVVCDGLVIATDVADPGQALAAIEADLRMRSAE